MVDKHQIEQFRREADEPQAHLFPKGIIGGSCNRCGANSANRHPCHKKSSVGVDRKAFHELLDLAEQSVDYEPLKGRIERAIEASEGSDPIQAMLAILRDEDVG